MYKWQTFKFSVHELLKLRQYAILCCTCMSHLYIHKHTCAHTHTHTHARAQGLYLNFIQSVMACLNFQNIYFRKYLLMAAFIRFKSACFSGKLKVDALFMKQPSYFLLGIFLCKESSKKHLHSHFHEEREFHHCFSSRFHNYFLRRHTLKTFPYWRSIKILISLMGHFQP